MGNKTDFLFCSDYFADLKIRFRFWLWTKFCLDSCSIFRLSPMIFWILTIDLYLMLRTFSIWNNQFTFFTLNKWTLNLTHHQVQFFTLFWTIFSSNYQYGPKFCPQSELKRNQWKSFCSDSYFHQELSNFGRDLVSESYFVLTVIFIENFIFSQWKSFVSNYFFHKEFQNRVS